MINEVQYSWLSSLLGWTTHAIPFFFLLGYIYLELSHSDSLSISSIFYERKKFITALKHPEQVKFPSVFAFLLVIFNKELTLILF